MDTDRQTDRPLVRLYKVCMRGAFLTTIHLDTFRFRKLYLKKQTKQQQKNKTNKWKKNNEIFCGKKFRNLKQRRQCTVSSTSYISPRFTPLTRPLWEKGDTHQCSLWNSNFKEGLSDTNNLQTLDLEKPGVVLHRLALIFAPWDSFYIKQLYLPTYLVTNQIIALCESKTNSNLHSLHGENTEVNYSENLIVRYACSIWEREREGKGRVEWRSLSYKTSAGVK